MALRFFGKIPSRKYVRQIPNEKLSASKELKEENNIQIVKDMADERLEKIENIIGSKAPKKKVKYDKRDKGLIERDDKSVVLLTDDNKMILND